MTTTTVGPTRPVVDGWAPDTPGELLGAGFPSAELVQAASSAFKGLAVLPGWDAGEGRRTRLTLSPGAVQLAVRDDARRERTRNAELGAFDAYTARRFLAGRKLAAGDDGLPSMQDLDGYAKWLGVDDPTPADRKSWRQVTEWSPKSRRRMTLTFAQLDYAALFSDGVPAMLTLTYPASWQELAPTGRHVKEHFRAFERRWVRRWKRPLRCLWKLEFQRRGAPHLHLFAVPPGDLRAFRAWLSITWAEIVGADVDSGERRRHVLAGTAVDYTEGARMRDPRRLAVYFLKHGQKTKDDKEYQHVVPELWRGRGVGPGRFWGYRGLVKATATVELHGRDFVVAKRTIRRWSRAQGRTRSVDVWRHDGTNANAWVDPRTGEAVGRPPRRRKVNRRTYQLAHGRFAGGWVIVNDGPGFALQLAAALRT